MELTTVLKALSSESKLKIIALFMFCKCNKYCVNDLCRALELQQANMSKHLSQLKDEGFLDFVKDGKEVYYKINDDFKNNFADLVEAIAKKQPSLMICTYNCSEHKTK